MSVKTELIISIQTKLPINDCKLRCLQSLGRTEMNEVGCVGSSRDGGKLKSSKYVQKNQSLFGVFFCPLLMPMSEAFSISFIL